ncbi:hypothetical protein HELRODRAFT_193394 [Helobdella robusta]|uniref:Uncharacterized protein n=1 Tax=Helobdella robusta TaxID=6412 RepID=T1FUY1_HELRO|nr:hypothetical protein HELRODRAFT_193394 [Helobdella robusta]ESN96906.1 hypothetical protein HELRODRAFT_193394 [Helobdella robusta]
MHQQHCKPPGDRVATTPNDHNNIHTFLHHYQRNSNPLAFNAQLGSRQPQAASLNYERINFASPSNVDLLLTTPTPPPPPPPPHPPNDPQCNITDLLSLQHSDFYKMPQCCQQQYHFNRQQLSFKQQQQQQQSQQPQQPQQFVDISPDNRITCTDMDINTLPRLASHEFVFNKFKMTPSCSSKKERNNFKNVSKNNIHKNSQSSSSNGILPCMNHDDRCKTVDSNVCKDEFGGQPVADPIFTVTQITNEAVH